MAWGSYTGRDGNGSLFSFLVDLVSGANALGVQQATEGAPLAQGTVSVAATDTQVKASNASRKRIEVSNGGTAGAWVRFGASAASVGTGNYLPPGSKDVYYTTSEVRAISSSGSLTFGYVEW